MVVTSPELSSLGDEIVARLLVEFQQFVESGNQTYAEIIWHHGTRYLYECEFDVDKQLNRMRVYSWALSEQPKRVLQLNMREEV